jgi:CysZ protein
VGLVADFFKALAQLSDPRFMRVLWRGAGLTLATLALISWAVVAGLGWFVPDVVTLPWIGPVASVDSVVSLAAIPLVLLLSVVLMVPVAAIVVGFFLDEIAAAVEARHYTSLPPAMPLAFSLQAADSFKFLGLVVAVNLVALVVYLAVPPFAPLVFWLVNGYLLGREYFQLVAMRRLGPIGAAELRRLYSLRIWGAGVLMAIPLSVPLLNLIVPIVGVAVFTHQFHRLARPTETAP